LEWLRARSEEAWAASSSRPRYAAERKIQRLTLRVLSVNRAARALYERHGYEVEGELRGEFHLPVGPAGRVAPVDDVLMAKTIASGEA
jgi:RimJ/RimL family protein N-acetyltransferase